MQLFSCQFDLIMHVKNRKIFFSLYIYFFFVLFIRLREDLDIKTHVHVYNTFTCYMFIVFSL